MDHTFAAGDQLRRFKPQEGYRLNYYPFHIGDYAAHTAHLDPIEDIAYRRALDLYYLREGPLPSDPSEVARLIRMRQNVTEVTLILSEFFVLSDDGWRKARCDGEIAHMRDKQLKAKASADASVKARQANVKQTLNERSAKALRKLAEKPTGVELPIPTPTPEENSEANASAGKPATDMTKAELWTAGKSLLLEAGVPKAQCGTFVGKLVGDYGDAIVINAVRAAVVATPADPKEYLKATCMRLKGERAEDHDKPLTVPMNPAAVAAQAAAEAEHRKRAEEIAAIAPERRAEIAQQVRSSVAMKLKVVA